MVEHLIDFTALILTAVSVMIIHELVKTILFSIIYKPRSYKVQIWKLYQYIDPIGLIFCITTQAGFSKPYMLRIKDKRANFLLGITGFLTLLILFLSSITIYIYFFQNKFVYNSDGSILLYTKSLPSIFLYYLYMSSLGMFLVNLFPVSTFDMGLLIAGKSPSKYFSIIKNDYLIKMILVITLFIRVIPAIINMVLRLFIIL